MWLGLLKITRHMPGMEGAKTFFNCPECETDDLIRVWFSDN